MTCSKEGLTPEMQYQEGIKGWGTRVLGVSREAVGQGTSLNSDVAWTQACINTSKESLPSFPALLYQLTSCLQNQKLSELIVQLGFSS